MCGIAGIVATGSDGSLRYQLDQMVKVQSHRGPDGEGSWFGRVGDAEVALGHLRLAIIDLTDAGRQPMVSPDGRHVLVYNGELYNYRELREELRAAGVQFFTQSDTEVLLQALITWGEEALARCNGMWAFAWLDRETGHLVLSRDRFGIKPLYLYGGKGHFLFASEIKSILTGCQERFAIDPSVVGRYLQQSLSDAQGETFFSGIRALPAGHCLRIDLRRPPAALSPARPYWTAPEHDSFVGNATQRIEAVRETFVDAVRLRLRSDVPVGVLLSGGVDSSSIAAGMQQTLGPDADLHLISAVSDDPRYDEQPFIDRMAAHLGRPVHKVPLRFGPEEAFRLLDEITWFNDEPVGGFSCVAHYLLMQEAKQLGVTVILSGQGADELLCGYRKYLGFYVQSLIQSGRWLAALKVLAGFIGNGTVVSQFQIAEAKRYLPDGLRPRARADIRGRRLKDHDGFRLDTGVGLNGVVGRQRADLYRFSVPSLVHYEDRMSMAASREIRLPFLDYRLVSMLLPLAPEWKLRDGWTKWVFRRAMEPYLPPDIAWRKDKQHFVNPQGEWLKHELRGKIEDLLRQDLLIAQSGLVDREALQRRYAAYCRQPANKGTISFGDVFNPIALELWARRFESHLRFV